jgi:hypothetical protein
MSIKLNHDKLAMRIPVNKEKKTQRATRADRRMMTEYVTVFTVDMTNEFMYAWK